MKTLRTALLAAAATLAGIPALAVAQTPQANDAGRSDRGTRDRGPDDHGHGDHDRGDRPDRGNHDGGPGGQADRGSRAPGGMAAQPQAQAPRARAPQPQAPLPPPVQAQRGGDDRRGIGRPDGDHDRRDDGARRGLGPGDGRPDPRFGPNAPGAQGGYAGRPEDRGRPGWDRGGPGWDRGGSGWNRDHGAGGWRNDRRYDWRGWRDQHRSLFRGPRYRPPRGYGYGYRAFSPGFRLEPFFYERGYWIEDPYAYRLPPAYGPYRWVRYYDDVLLVDLRSGTIVDVIRDFFW